MKLYVTEALALKRWELQVIRRWLTILIVIFGTATPALAERPRPLAWAMDAMRDGDWQTAAKIAARDGDVAADVIEWSRLRAGKGSYEEVISFLQRRPDWPGERYLRKQSERVVIAQNDSAVLAFFADTPAQTPEGVLRHAVALSRSGAEDRAEATVLAAWKSMPMGATAQALFLANHQELLKDHHAERLDAMLWAGAFENARRLYDLVPAADVAVAKARIALRGRAKGVDTLIALVPKSHANAPGLQYERFVWRARKGRAEDAMSLLQATSTSAAALGNPEAWANRRRAIARQEMREGNAERAYEIASRHFLTSGSNYADLEWLSGYIALRKLKEPETALQHFRNHGAAVRSPISKGRSGYWQGRALEAMGDVAAADQAYADAAQYPTSFYGLLAADRADLPFDEAQITRSVDVDWRDAPLSKKPVFVAGLLLQASGELDLAERFWTHLAESLDYEEAALLAEAALDTDQPHLAVMIGKRTARRAVVVPRGYYALHPVAEQNLPMAAEMVLAIARRESEFDPGVQSGVGARGLMQIMPATGREVAALLGRKGEHSTERLISDPEYNAQLGAAYLSRLASRFRGNVVMMSAGYNAGPSRPDRWMLKYGDPRKGEVDMVDWIEHIPFRETRNYVMRVAESLPVYRARLGKPAMPVPFIDELTGSTLLAFAPKGE
ncbi:lytic transglycosylase domain-containing protein [Roseobacter sp. YSTF-M11]|uniref:Lytic transglycosylase domain-containing protein n=1 Tax=Roseobacter insulae TaxID=2859783 RepID=A0A9X1FY27_9RHOB|nr:lytic transglycosylase domain-containing protein [Roseobacter insulae]MBW4709427.1 lytic transglycosylase domain-containing protein [Roseobacter insulae]